MRQFIAQVSKEKTMELDPELFDRTEEKSIAEYIVSGLKVIESLPYIKFTKWKLIEDASKIDIKLNRKHIKDRNIDKNKDIKKIISIRDTAQEMLTMTFSIDYEGEHRFIKKNLLIPSYIDKYHLLINGKEVLPQKQIVDMSTYNQKRSLKLKTTLTPIDLYKEEIKTPFISTDNDNFSNIKTFILNLFTKELNPLYYYMAKFGLHKTINYFGMKDIIDIVDQEYNKEINYYFQINKELFLEVDKRFFNSSDFIKAFSYMVFDMFKGRVKLDIVDDINYWVTKLGMLFTTNTKNQLAKGLNVLVSFDRILDDITRDTLRIDKKHLQSTHSLLRWLIQNYVFLRKKNNHDLANKRMRCNEVTAFYFIQSMSQRINQLLNKKKLTIEAIERIFNWNSDELFRIMLSNKNTLLKYDADINCFDMLNGLRFSFLGSQGISGGKNIGDQFRDIYPSHLGRIDLNGISHGKNTALTGFITPKCKIYGNGFFSKRANDPDEFGVQMNELRKSLYNPTIEAIKNEINYQKNSKLKSFEKREFEKREGCIVIHRRYNILKNKDNNTVVIGARNSPSIDYQRSYINSNGIRVNEDDLVIIKRRNERPKEDGLFKISKSSIPTNRPSDDSLIKIHRRPRT